MKRNEVIFKTRESSFNSMILISLLGLFVGSILGFLTCSQNIEFLKGIF